MICRTDTRTEHNGSARALVSVVVPVRNEGRSIRRVLECLLHQRAVDCSIEIIVVDGQSADDTRKIAEDYCKQYAQVRLLDNPDKLSSAARNQAIRTARGDFVIVVDGHCEISSDTYIADMLELF